MYATEVASLDFIVLHRDFTTAILPNHTRYSYQTEENPEQAIFAVYCMIGDWLLAEFWLSQFRKCINFDFQLHNYCDTIEQVGFMIIAFHQAIPL